MTSAHLPGASDRDDRGRGRGRGDHGGDRLPADAAPLAPPLARPLGRRTFLVGGAAGLGLVLAAPSAAIATPSPTLPNEARRQQNLVTARGGTLYDSIVVKIGGDAARLFVPQSVKPGDRAHVVWFYHAAESDQDAIQGGYRAAAERAVDRGAIGICQYAGGTLYSSPTATAHQQRGYAYLAGVYSIAASYLRATSAGGALAAEAYGAPLMPDVHGMYFVNAVYDIRKLYNMGGRQALSVGMAFGYSTSAIDRANPARFAQANWTGSKVRVVVSSPSSTDASVPPDDHGLALIAKAKPVAVEASVRTHAQGHTTPGFADSDFDDALGRWIALVDAGGGGVEVPDPVAEWTFGEASGPYLASGGGLPLADAGTAAATRITTPWGGGIRLGGAAWLRLPLAGAAALNLGAGTGRGTVACWVRQRDPNAGFVAGMWHDQPSAPARCYGLFYDLATYGGDDRVCFHVSRTGLPTPGYPSAREYAATSATTTDERWQLLVGTYDGAEIRAYLDGEFSPYPTFTDTRGATYAKNPYAFTAGANPRGADFTVGASLANGSPGNLAIADLALLRVWDRALTADEVRALHRADATAL
ncbi:LamG-like jellyroll fold domain-containing protein [Agromyces sp. MMS24-K17]|uniref:LamG-like jellyroll fold domain-containing protein n=1 Tax=Agromyces sp. MMS24-K17 TaxID=3372850 RepID=UPI0037543983